MRVLSLLLISVAQLVAACPVTTEGQLFYDVRAHYISFHYDTDTVGTSTRTRVAFYAPSLDTAWEFRGYEGAGFGTVAGRGLEEYGFAASTAYRFDPQVTATDGTTWSDYTQCQAALCPDGAGAQSGGRNYSCVEQDAAPACGGAGCFVPTVTTPAEPATYPEVPVPVTITKADPYTPPTVTGNTYIALVTNLNAQMAACAAQANIDGLVHEVVLAPATQYRPEGEGGGLEYYTAPNITHATGFCWVRSGADPKYLPPPGVAIDPDYERSGQLTEITHNRTTRGWSKFDSEIIQQAASGGTDHWRFGPGIVFRQPTPAEVVETAYTVTAFDNSTGKLTSAAHGLLANNSHVQIELAGVEHWQAHRSCTTVGKRASGGITVNDVDNFSCSALVGAEGTFTSGKWTTDAARVLTGCTSGGLCTSANTLPWGNFHTYTITASSGTTITVSDATITGIQPNSSVEITGCGANDGIYGVSATGAGTITTTTALPGSCSTGTVKQIGMVLLGGTDVEAAHDAYLADFPSSTTVQLRNYSAGATTGGWVSYDPPIINSGFFKFSDASSSDLVWDRIITKMDLPYRVRGNFNLFDASNVAVVGSWIQGAPWTPVDPNTNRGSVQIGWDTFQLGGNPFGVHCTDDLTIGRTRFIGPGADIFSDSFNCTPTNWRIESIESFKSPWTIPGNAAAGNVGYMHPTGLEVKHVDGLDVNGYFVDGQADGRQPSGAYVQISYQPTSDGQKLEDIRLRNMQIRAASCIEVTTRGNGTAVTAVYPPRRMSFENILCITDRADDTLHSNPVGQGLEIPNAWPNAGGSALRILAGDSINVSNMTARLRGNWPVMLWARPRSLTGFRIADSIFTTSDAGTVGDVHGDSNNWDTEIFPAVATSADGWILYREANHMPFGVFDPTGELDVKFIPGSTSYNVSNWKDLTNNLHTTLAAEMDCSGEPGGCPSNVSIEILASPGDGASLQQREDAVYEAGTWTLKPGVWAGYGYNKSAVEDALLRLRDIAASGIAGGIRLSYTAPADKTCHRQFTPDTVTVDGQQIPDWGSASVTSWQSDTPGLAARTVDTTGLTPGQVYWGRATCGLQHVLIRERAQ